MIFQVVVVAVVVAAVVAAVVVLVVVVSLCLQMPKAAKPGLETQSLKPLP